MGAIKSARGRKELGQDVLEIKEMGAILDFITFVGALANTTFRRGTELAHDALTSYFSCADYFTQKSS